MVLSAADFQWIKDRLQMISINVMESNPKVKPKMHIVQKDHTQHPKEHAHFLSTIHIGP